MSTERVPVVVDHHDHKKFLGNPTGSNRTRQPLRVVGELSDWAQHPPEAVQGMLAGVAQLRAEGRDVIGD